MMHDIVDSPLGNIILTSDGECLTGLYFDGQKYMPNVTQMTEKADNLPIFAEVRQWLRSYFAGDCPRNIPRLNPQGTDFQKLVWQTLFQIDYGMTLTYGDVARRVADRMGVPSMSAQAVGNAIGRNPISIIIPCHRVVGAKDRLTGYAGGLERKRWLLMNEGKP